MKKWHSENSEYCNKQSKKWRYENPEKYKEYYKKYRENNSEKCKERHKKWRSENPEHVKKCNKKWYENNPEKCKEYRYKRVGYGFNPINNYFDCSNAHHLWLEDCSDFVIYLPQFLHKLYYHSHHDETSMITPNSISIDYWLNEDYYKNLYNGDD